MGKLYDDYFVKPRQKPSVIQTLNKLRPLVTEITTASRKPGRPKKAGALSPAERQAKRRALLKASQ